jgi:AdoMet-dependent heme synthase
MSSGYPAPPLKEITIQGSTPEDRESLPLLARPELLSFPEMIVLIDQIAEMASPPETIRFDGFDPSSETVRIVEYARVRRLRPRIRLSRTSLTTDSLEELAAETEAVIVIPIESAVTDDGDDSMIRIAEHAALLGLEVEIETLLRPAALYGLPILARFVKASGFDSWSIDFLGDPKLGGGILTSRETVRAFSILPDLPRRTKTKLLIREAPSFRRFLSERSRPQIDGRITLERAARFHVLKSRDSLFISRTGEVTPGRALPLPAGSVRDSEIEVIRAHSPILQALQDLRQLRGRCGACDMADTCGGSRARAWRVTRNPLAEDPGCFRAPARTSPALGVQIRPSL